MLLNIFNSGQIFFLESRLWVCWYVCAVSVCLCSQLNVPQCWCYTRNLRFPCHTRTNIHKHTNPCPNSELTTVAGLPGFSPWKVANRLKDGFLGWTVLSMRDNFISEGGSTQQASMTKLQSFEDYCSDPFYTEIWCGKNHVLSIRL